LGEKTLYIKFKSIVGVETSTYTKKITLLNNQNEEKKEVENIPATTETCPINFIRNLKLGMIGNDVKELQKYLNRSGYTVTKTGFGSPDNETTKFGVLTKKALIKFQKAKGISPATGYLGPITRSYLDCVKTEQLKTLITSFNFTRNLKLGMIGNDVKELQKRLTSEGVYKGPITEYFGPLTLAGVKKFQAKYNLDQVGIVGPLTRGLLNKN
ncbi:MAG: peptidoglycan-binding protein, partial [Patescibacteria group bacterium]